MAKKPKFITPEIKGLNYSLPSRPNDILSGDAQISAWEPHDRSSVELHIELEIGLMGKDGADFFQVHVVTVDRLSQIKDKNRVVAISYYEGWDQVWAEIEKIVFAERDASWPAFCERVGKVFFWEYEGMT